MAYKKYWKCKRGGKFHNTSNTRMSSVNKINQIVSFVTHYH